MPALLHSPFAVQKPPAGAQIDWGHPLAQGLVFCLPLNGESGNGFFDLVTNASNTQDAGLKKWSPGQEGMALSFTGADWLNFPGRTQWQMNTAFTASSQVRLIAPATGVDGAIISIGGSINPGWMMWASPWSGGNVQINGYMNSSTRVTSSTIPQGSFVRLTMVWNGATVSIYINNKLDASAAYSTPPAGVVNRPLQIGSYAATRYLDGTRFSDAFLWNRALSASTISQLFQEPYSMLRHPDVWRQYFTRPPIQYTQSEAGALTSSGSIVRQVSKVLGGDL